ncbi:MAG TPA: alpha/beta hydrolase family protein, partial [Prochlorococcus sp.]
MRFDKRLLFAAIFCGVAAGMISRPAIALERLVFNVPVLDVQIDFELGEAKSAGDLIEVNPDFVEFDRATDGAFLLLLEELFNTRLSVQIEKVVEESVGQPLLEQALMAVSKVAQVEGLPQDNSGRMLFEALARTSKSSQPTILGLLRQIPGQTASINLSKLVDYLARLKRNQLQSHLIAEKEASMQIEPQLRMPLSGSWIRKQVAFRTPHRPKPIQVVVIQPKASSNGRLVVISHGLWESPNDLQGWAEYLSVNGYTVLLPEHQGSDLNQQKVMLAGYQPPPGPQELRLRALDVTALLTAIETDDLLPGSSLNTTEVAVVGHSWGATTAIQLAG